VRFRPPSQLGERGSQMQLCSGKRLVENFSNFRSFRANSGKFAFSKTMTPTQTPT
jgi:hypothetical protein